jgi:hypothetical protein
MRLLLKLLGGLLALSLLAITGLAVLVYSDSRPLVIKDHTLTEAERTWARQWLSNANPQDRQEGDRVLLTLSEREANILSAYLIDKVSDKVGEGRLAVTFARDRARLAASLGLPWDPQGHFINLELELVSGDGLPRITEARLAGLPIPGALAQTLADRLIQTLDQSRLLQRVDLIPGLALVTYEWHPEALNQVGGGLLSVADRTRVLPYQEALQNHTAKRPKDAKIPLTELLSLVLIKAGQRPDTDPQAENQAAILALTAYINHQTVRDPSRPALTGPKPPWRTVTLKDRADLANHFMASAAITGQGGDALSDLIGLFKEVADAQDGSGFSFADLTADRAGTRFASLATGTRQGALAMQNAALKGLHDTAILPTLEDLPEGLDQATFAATFQDTKSPAYRRLSAQIEQRIDALPLFRQATR